MPVQPPQWTDFLSCPICYTVFNETVHKPISLACGHTMCKKCLATLCKKQCPFDQAMIQRDVDELPVNFALLQLVGIEISLERDVVPSNIVDQYVKHYAAAKKCVEELALYLKPLGKGGTSIGACVLSRPMQRKLVALLNCQLVEDEGRSRALRAARSLGERTVTELILQHQNPQQLSANLWAAVRGRGCQFLGPAMQEETLKLVLLALEDGTALSRKVLVLFVVQRLEPQFPQASKTSVGHVVQLLYRASCFKVTKRDADSSLMQLKEEFRNYEALRREHDAQIVQIAMEAGLRISPEQWSSLLYGDLNHKSHMQSIIDKLQTPASFSSSINELTIALQRSGDPGNLKLLQQHLEYLAEIDGSTESSVPSWEECEHAMSAVKLIVQGFVDFAQNFSHTRKTINQQTPNVTFKTTMCRDIQKGGCPRGSNCTFAHSDRERKEHRAESRRLMQTMTRQTSQTSIGEKIEKKSLVSRGLGHPIRTPSPNPVSGLPNMERETISPHDMSKHPTAIGRHEERHSPSNVDDSTAQLYAHKVQQESRRSEGVARAYGHHLHDEPPLARMFHQEHQSQKEEEEEARLYGHGRYPPPHAMYQYEDPYYYEAYSHQGFRYPGMKRSSPPYSSSKSTSGHPVSDMYSPVQGQQHPGPYRQLKARPYEAYETYPKHEKSNYLPWFREPPDHPIDYQYSSHEGSRKRQPYPIERNGGYGGYPPPQPVLPKRGWEQHIYGRRTADVADHPDAYSSPVARQYSRDKMVESLRFTENEMECRRDENKDVLQNDTVDKNKEMTDVSAQNYNVPSINQLNEREAKLIDLLTEMSPNVPPNTIFDDPENFYHSVRMPRMAENKRPQYKEDFTRFYRQDSSNDTYSSKLLGNNRLSISSITDDQPVYEMFPANKEVCTKLTPTLSKTHIRHVSTRAEKQAHAYHDFNDLENLSLKDVDEQPDTFLSGLDNHKELSPLVISTTNLSSERSALLNSPVENVFPLGFGPISRSCRTSSKISNPVQVNAGKAGFTIPVKLNLDCHTAPALQEPSGYYSGFHSPWSNEFSTLSWGIGERLPSLVNSGENEEEQKRKIKEELKFVQNQIQCRKDATDIQLVERECKAIAEHDISCKTDSKLMDSEASPRDTSMHVLMEEHLKLTPEAKDNLVWAKHCFGRSQANSDGN
ncbi:uncharacterized protein [Antedon mediterranea]|uniref:uncharacterized protein n=1 Tax=Antedon mediterranea TaxID=105859 RepID=UPI003AF89B94